MFSPNLYLTLKTLHIVFVVSWFAGLFYLPRIYVNLAQVDPQDTRTYDTLLGMAFRLMRFSNKVAGFAITFGIALMVIFHVKGAWLHIKLFFVTCTILYHLYCARIYYQFKNHTNQHSHIYYRWFNEIPVFFLLIIVGLVIFKRPITL